MVELEIQLSYEKLIGKNDLSWEEIREMSGSEFTAEHIRKLAYGYKRIIESNYFESQEDEKIIEARKELIKLSTSKAELNKMLREATKKEFLYQQVAENIERIPAPKFKRIQTSTGEKTHMLHISDIHYGSIFKVEGNEYNIEIAHERFAKLIEEVAKRVQAEKINKLIVVNTGDSIQGMLRMSDVKKNEVPVVESVIGFSKTMGTFLNDLSEFVNVEYHHVSSANHSEPRFINTGAGDMPEEDFEKIIVNYIADLTRDNKRIVVNTDISKPYIELDLQGFNGIALHGHTIKNFNNAIRDLSQTNKKFYNYLIAGHIHHTHILETDSDCMVLIAPSFVGVCPYSKKILKTSNAGANFYTFEKGKGLVNIGLINLQ